MIRLARIKDKDKIIAIGNTFNPKFYKTYDIENYINNEKYLIIISEEKEDIYGFMIILKNIDCYELEFIIVSEKYRNKGIASDMITYFLNIWNKDNKPIILEVSNQNEKAINLYKKFNFNIINTRKKYYDGIDAYVMKR